MTWKRVVSIGLAEVSGLGRLAHPAHGLRILLYHAIGTALEDATYGLSVAPERFKEQMKWLSGYGAVQVAPLAPLPEISPDHTQVALTFDDGYRDALTAAAPVLAEFNIPFTVFVVPQYASSGDVRYLSVSELRALSRIPGCSIGSHSMTHQRLTRLEPSALQQELRDSKSWLEDVLGKAVTAIAYPHGEVDQRVCESAAHAGYVLGVCSQSGINAAGRNPLLLRRTEILAEDALRVFRQKIKGSWDWHRFRHCDPAGVQ